MKRFKTIIAIVTLIMMIPSMQSCLDDYDDNLYDISNSIPVNAALATVVTPSKVPGEAIIESDNEGTAYVTNPEILTQNDANNKGQRIFYTYRGAESPNGNSNSKAPYIQITTLYKILTKDIDILKEEQEDVFGDDVINYISYNIGKTHLTLQFQILGYDINIKHRISLVAKADAVPDSDGYLSVELRHNAEGDRQENLSSSSFVSFPLSSAPGYNEGTLKGFKIKYKSIYSGEKTVTIGYNNSKSADFQFDWEAMSNTKIK